jgi:hypothetical protein
MTCKIAYDPEVKVLSIRLKPGRSVDSEIKGNLVLDYNSKGELVKLDIMDVDLEELVNSGVPTEDFKVKL